MSELDFSQVFFCKRCGKLCSNDTEDGVMYYRCRIHGIQYIFGPALARKKEK